MESAEWRRTIANVAARIDAAPGIQGFHTAYGWLLELELLRGSKAERIFPARKALVAIAPQTSKFLYEKEDIEEGDELGDALASMVEAAAKKVFSDPGKYAKGFALAGSPSDDLVLVPFVGHEALMGAICPNTYTVATLFENVGIRDYVPSYVDLSSEVIRFALSLPLYLKKVEIEEIPTALEERGEEVEAEGEAEEEEEEEEEEEAESSSRASTAAKAEIRNPTKVVNAYKTLRDFELGKTSPAKLLAALRAVVHVHSSLTSLTRSAAARTARTLLAVAGYDSVLLEQEIGEKSARATTPSQASILWAINSVFVAKSLMTFTGVSATDVVPTIMSKVIDSDADYDVTKLPALAPFYEARNSLEQSAVRRFFDKSGHGKVAGEGVSRGTSTFDTMFIRSASLEPSGASGSVSFAALSSYLTRLGGSD